MIEPLPSPFYLPMESGGATLYEVADLVNIIAAKQNEIIEAHNELDRMFNTLAIEYYKTQKLDHLNKKEEENER